ncbi:MAG: hypothetical protein KBC69_00135 [Candidatus Magasanikbacteria bacterium]|nr:hypothetical protein [Candidatus Magasanikbacteria bacterium]
MIGKLLSKVGILKEFYDLLTPTMIAQIIFGTILSLSLLAGMIATIPFSLPLFLGYILLEYYRQDKGALRSYV